jgi:hypothetical protein
MHRMPPTYRTPNSSRSLEDDIIQRNVANNDWSNRELLERLGLLNCSRAQLFRFLTAVVDPMMQTPEVQAELAICINELLGHDGYSLVMSGRVPGSPRYEVRPPSKGAPADEGISATLFSFDPTQVHPRWIAALERRSSDPSGAITLARTLLEDTCKWIWLKPVKLGKRAMTCRSSIVGLPRY